MSDSLEIPEAKRPFEKRVAITIAVLAAALSFIGNVGDNAKTDAIIKTNEASNAWGYYQAKSIKERICGSEMDTLGILFAGGDRNALDEKTKSLREDIARYQKESSEIKSDAEKLTQEAAHCSKVNDRCDQSSLILQLAIILCSVAILSEWRALWLTGIAAGAVGVILGATALML